MRILAITPELPTAGSPGSMAPGARQIQSLRDLGLDVTVQDMRGTRVLKYLKAPGRMRRELGRIDLIHAHFGYCGWIARMQWRVPVVISFMGDDLLGTPQANGDLEWFSRVMVQANKRLAKWVTQVIVKSQEMAEVIAPVPCHVIPNGIDTRLFRPLPQAEALQKLGWDDQKTYLLFPGNPDNPRKGFALASEATQVAEQQLGRPIELVPLWRVDPDLVPFYMNACHAMWMTSRIEGSPNVVKEAMACDLPVVAVPVGDVEQLCTGVSGYAVCPRQPEALGTRMASLLQNRPAVHGRQNIEARGLSLEKVAQRIAYVYRLALRQPPGSSETRLKIDPAAAILAEPVVPATCSVPEGQ
jgi:glycosyltransferase involved in cell wall biosynthesis